MTVPRWVVLGADCFAAYRAETGLDREIARLLAGFSPERAAVTARSIADAMLARPVSAALRDVIARAHAHVGSGSLAVRSSGIEEDGVSFSFAGQFDTFLGVCGLPATLEHVRRCWASAYSERALSYRHRHGLDIAATEMAVILQPLIPAEKSGVIFTVNPANGNRDEIVLSAVYGLGEGLVSGAVDADTITLDRASGRVKQAVVGEKHERHDGGTVSAVPAALRDKLAVSPAEIARVLAAARRIEDACGSPQDIEWCMVDRQLWILQARPVTTPCAPADADPPAAGARGEVRLWDNSNIVENYPGVTTQLTFTFAQHVYSHVFREFARLIGVPPRQLNEMDGFLGSVLGFLNGRVYYNLLNWYKLSGLAPFQDVGRKMMEIQMGVGEQLDLDEFAGRIAPYSTASRFEHARIRAKTGAAFARYFVTLERRVAEFRRFFYGIYDRFDALDYRSMPADEVYAHYARFERELLARWGSMIALESAIGLSYALVRRLIKRWMPDAPEWLEVAVIGGMDEIESVAPVHRLSSLAAQVRADPRLTELIMATPSGVTLERLRAGGEHDLAAEIDRYIADFGYRSKNELKLEEPDLRDDPGVLFDMLKAAVANGAAAPERATTEARIGQLIRERLNPLQRWIFARARARARSAIQARETVRFCRSRAFGVARRMFRAIGEGLARDGVLETGSDVFHLRLDEIRGSIEGAVSQRELRPLIAQRRSDYAAYRAMEDLPPRFVTRGPVAAWLSRPENLAAAQALPAAAGGTVLRGTPCAPGVAEGAAQVVQEANEFTGGVLVAYRTDPGWVAVFGSAQALLIERGSPLTHAAIVARELGVPTIVQIPGLTKQVRTGMRLKVDGNDGRIELPAA